MLNHETRKETMRERGGGGGRKSRTKERRKGKRIMTCNMETEGQ